MQCAAIMAAFVYNTAMRDQMMPRVPMPKALPEREADHQIGVLVPVSLPVSLSWEFETS